MRRGIVWSVAAFATSKALSFVSILVLARLLTPEQFGVVAAVAVGAIAGSKYNNEVPGSHKVFSRSEVSTAWNGKAFLPHMIRWLKTDIGAIGFHGIPRHVSDGSRYEKDSELGTRLSGGCTRQADLDANCGRLDLA